jgi:hypothetical protein
MILFSLIDYDQTAIGLLPVTFAVFVIAKSHTLHKFTYSLTPAPASHGWKMMILKCFSAILCMSYTHKLAP